MSNICAESETKEELIANYTKLQSELRRKVITSDTEHWAMDLESIELIGGMDISYDKSDSSRACVTCVVMDVKNEFKIVYNNNSIIRPVNGYIAGFLAFREIEFLVKEFQSLQQKHSKLLPQIWLIDGNGLLHPRELGLASHFGVIVDQPAIGVAKNPYYMTLVDQSIKADHKTKVSKLMKSGDQLPITNSCGEVIGVALRTGNDCKKPVYVSIGHKISLNTAINVVLKCCRYRVPEPLRMADIISRQQIQQTVN